MRILDKKLAIPNKHWAQTLRKGFLKKLVTQKKGGKNQKNIIFTFLKRVKIQK